MGEAAAMTRCGEQRDATRAQIVDAAVVSPIEVGVVAEGAGGARGARRDRASGLSGARSADGYATTPWA